MLHGININRVFRNIGVDPGDINLLGIYHDSLYIDTALHFGFCHGSVLFQHCSDAFFVGVALSNSSSLQQEAFFAKS